MVEPQSLRERIQGFWLTWGQVTAGHIMWLRRTKDSSSTKVTIPNNIATKLDEAARDGKWHQCGLIENVDQLEAATYIMKNFIANQHPVVVMVFGFSDEDREKVNPE